MSTWLCTMFAKCLRLTAERPPRVTRLAVTNLETGDELLHGRVSCQDSRFSGRHRPRSRQPFLLIDSGEGRNASASLAGARGRRAGAARRGAGATAFPGGAPPEPGEFLLGRTRERIAIGLTGVEDVPGEGDELAGGGHDGDVAIFAALEFADEGAEGARMTIHVLGRLHQQPADMARALFRDVAGVTVLGRLTDRGNQTQIGGQPRGGGKPADSPIAASRAVATATSIPGSVSKSRTCGSVAASSTCVCSSAASSCSTAVSRRLSASTAARSAGGNATVVSQARPARENKSGTGQGSNSWCSTLCRRFFSRVRSATSTVRRVLNRRAAKVVASGIHTGGR